MASDKSNLLVDEKEAVENFLDALLREPEEATPAAAVEVKTVDVPPVLNMPKLEIPVAEPEPEAPLEVEVKTKTEAPVQTPESEIITKTEQETSEETKPVSARPDWAEAPFQILLFEVAGLKLAVPLIELSAVIEWTDNVTEMPGHADFYMGILQHLEHKVAVIDTARMVMPANKLQELAGDDPRERVRHIVLIDDYRWGLACDKIGEVITLQPEEVRWRSDKTRRGWLAGTVINHMCALLNSDGFAKMLEKGKEPGE